MTRSPRTIDADAMAVTAVDLMEKHRISQLLVTDADGVLIGALNTYDLLDAKVI